LRVIFVQQRANKHVPHAAAYLKQDKITRTTADRRVLIFKPLSGLKGTSGNIETGFLTHFGKNITHATGQGEGDSRGTRGHLTKLSCL
jgi:hypothetical protein